MQMCWEAGLGWEASKAPDSMFRMRSWSSGMSGRIRLAGLIHCLAAQLRLII